MNSLIVELNECGQSVIELASECPPEQATAQPGEGKWSVRHVLCHMIDTERLIFRPRMEKIIQSATEPETPSIDHATWEVDHAYIDTDFLTAMKDFLKERAITVAMLQATPAELASKTGMHDERGRISLSDVIQYTIDHTRIHEAQISRTMAVVAQLPSLGDA